MNRKKKIPENEENKEIEKLNDNPLANTTLSSGHADYDSDMDRYKQAIAASEPSFTIEPEKGINPDLETLNKKGKSKKVRKER